jgi:hypothetical protein
MAVVVFHFEILWPRAGITEMHEESRDLKGWSFDKAVAHIAHHESIVWDSGYKTVLDVRMDCSVGSEVLGHLGQLLTRN